MVVATNHGVLPQMNRSEKASEGTALPPLFERFDNGDVRALIAAYPLAWICGGSGSAIDASRLPLIGVQTYAVDNGTSWTAHLVVITQNAAGTGTVRLNPSAAYGQILALAKCT